MKTRRLNRKPNQLVSKTHKELVEYLSKTSLNLFYEYPCSVVLKRYKNNLNEEDYKYLQGKLKDLHVDIFDATMKMVFEIQGQQHYKYIPFFHGNMNGFDRQQINDRAKELMCKMLGLKLIKIDVNTKITKELIDSFYS